MSQMWSVIRNEESLRVIRGFYIELRRHKRIVRARSFCFVKEKEQDFVLLFLINSD